MRLLLLAGAAAVLALAVALLVPPDRRATLARLAAAERGVGATRRPTDRGRWTLLVPVVGLVAVVLTGVGAGANAAVVTLALVATALTVARLGRRHLLERRRERHRIAVARACAAVAAQVRIGRVPSVALSAAAEDHLVLRAAARTRELGGDVVASLHALARAPGQAGLGDLARAWQFSLHTGAPMADVLDQVATSLRDDQATQRTVAAELAGPRASGLVMAVLPVLGIGLGYLIGGDPISFLVAGPLGWGCLLVGTGSALVGVMWMDRLARVHEPGAP